MRKYKVAVCVVTYFPQIEKLMDTLKSIVKQRNIDFQIVISDDGSTENHFEEVKRYFNEVGFNDYELVALKENQGTVKNLEQAILVSNAEYIKDIGPGDCLSRDTILAEWVEYLEKSKRSWSFSDVCCYSLNEQNDRVFFPCYANPQMIKVYSKCNDIMCRWNYVVLDDIALGAAILCRRDLMQEYIQEISGKVKYAEDNIYRLMMFDGYVPAYFSEGAVLYEQGSGISTSGSKVWAKRLQIDWKMTDSIILSRLATEPIQKKMKDVLENREKGGRIMRKFRRYMEKGRICLMIKQRMNKRLTT